MSLSSRNYQEEEMIARRTPTVPEPNLVFISTARSGQPLLPLNAINTGVAHVSEHLSLIGRENWEILLLHHLIWC
jgi:hypothetical protein